MKGQDAIAQVYASALLELAYSKGVPAEVERDLQEVKRILDTNAKVLAFLVTPNIRKDAKCQVIDRAFGGRVAESVHNFLKVLVDKGRTVVLPRIIETFSEMFHERQGELVVSVKSALPLEDDERDRLRATLKKKYKKAGYNEVILNERVEPALLGGLILRTGDNVFDASLRSRLSQIGDRLLTSRLKNEEIYED